MSEEAKHTPGPWRTFNGTDVFPDDDDREGSRHIADFDMSHGIPAEEKKANARLAAAAPDLLEALKYAGELLEYGGFDMAKINAAIAKAEGLS